MDVKKLAKKMHNAKYSSHDMGRCLVAQNYLSELLMDEFFDAVQKELEKLEEIEDNETRGKPTSLAEYREYLGE